MSANWVSDMAMTLTVNKSSTEKLRIRNGTHFVAKKFQTVSVGCPDSPILRIFVDTVGNLGGTITEMQQLA